MIIDTKFNVGDKVFLGRAEWTTEMVECPSCKGSGYWNVVGHGGEFGTWQVSCQVCKDYQNWSDTARGRGQVKRSGRSAVVTLLTVGSIQLDTNREEETRYMCVETGVGTGTCWSEKDLFHTREEAQAHAEAEVLLHLPEAVRKDLEQEARKATSEMHHCTRPKRIRTFKREGPMNWCAMIQDVTEVTGYSTEKKAIQALAERLAEKL